MVRVADSTRLPSRTRRDAQLRPEITRVWQNNRQVYGAKKVRKQMHREQLLVAR